MSPARAVVRVELSPEFRRLLARTTEISARLVRTQRQLDSARARGVHGPALGRLRDRQRRAVAAADRLLAELRG